MQNGIKEIKLIQKNRSRQFIVSGRSETRDGTIYVIRFYDNDNSTCAQTVAKAMDGYLYSLRDVELERGLYTVGIQKCIDFRKKDFESEEKLKTKLMAGEPYAIDIHLEEQAMYGYNGVKVIIVSYEKEIGNNEICYQIQKAGNLYAKIRYWIPMNNSSQLEFFIAKVKPQEVKFKGAQEDIYKINLLIDGGNYGKN